MAKHKGKKMPFNKKPRGMEVEVEIEVEHKKKDPKAKKPMLKKKMKKGFQ